MKCLITTKFHNNEILKQPNFIAANRAIFFLVWVLRPAHRRKCRGQLEQFRKLLK